MSMSGMEVIEECNKFIKQNKIVYDTHEKKLIWIYYPKLFKQLTKMTVPSKIRKDSELNEEIERA